jgi:hypothetical protein
MMGWTIEAFEVGVSLNYYTKQEGRTALNGFMKTGVFEFLLLAFVFPLFFSG